MQVQSRVQRDCCYGRWAAGLRCLNMRSRRAKEKAAKVRVAVRTLYKGFEYRMRLAVEKKERDEGELDEGKRRLSE